MLALNELTHSKLCMIMSFLSTVLGTPLLLYMLKCWL